MTRTGSGRGRGAGHASTVSAESNRQVVETTGGRRTRYGTDDPSLDRSPDRTSSPQNRRRGRSCQSPKIAPGDTKRRRTSTAKIPMKRAVPTAAAAIGSRSAPGGTKATTATAPTIAVADGESGEHAHGRSQRGKHHHKDQPGRERERNRNPVQAEEILAQPGEGELEPDDHDRRAMVATSRPCTKRSGNVTEIPTEAIAQGEKRATNCPISAPVRSVTRSEEHLDERPARHARTPATNRSRALRPGGRDDVASGPTLAEPDTRQRTAVTD